MTRVSIVQGLGGHDECVTPLVYTFNQIRVQCDVYINYTLLEKRGNIFKALEFDAEQFIIDDNFKINSIDPPSQTNRIFWLNCDGRKQKQLIKKNIKHTLPLAFWTTFVKPSKQFNFWHELGITIYGFIHSSLLKARYERLFEYSNTKAVSFCQGMQDILEEYRHRMVNFYLPPMSHSIGIKKERHDPSKIRVAVPGKVDYHHRDYDLLVEFAIKAQTNYPNKFEFVIAGGVAGEDGEKLINSIQSNALEQTILLPPMKSSNESRFLEYAELFDLLESCDYALENSNSVFEDNSKISGAINLCINFQLPIIYLKGFAMYKEFNDLAYVKPEDLFTIASGNKPGLHKQLKTEAKLLKLLMEDENRRCLLQEVRAYQNNQLAGVNPKS